MKRRWAALLMIILLTGCAPHADEPEGLALGRILLVEGGDGVTLAALCGDGVQVSTRAQSFAEGREALPWAGEREVALTNISYIIINKGAKPEEVLPAVFWDGALSPAARLWYTDEPLALAEGSADLVGRLEVLDREGGISPPTVAEALAEVTEQGWVSLPCLRLEAGMAEPGGWMVWSVTEG